MSILTENLIVNKAIIKTAGINEAIIYSELRAMSDELRRHGKLINDEWFCYLASDFEKNTTIKPKTLRRTLEKLKELNLIEIEIKGLPAKRHFKLNPLEKMVQ